QCRLPADQGVGSLLGAWDRLPIPLVFDREFYTEENGKVAAELKRAVATWNEWAALKGKVAFVIFQEGQGAEIPDVGGCSSAAYTAASPGVVGVWKIGRDGKRANQRESC